MLGLFATKVDRKFDRITLCGSGKRIFESYSKHIITSYISLWLTWNCFVWGRLHLLAGISSVLIICIECALALWRAAISLSTWIQLLEMTMWSTSSQHAVTAPAMLISRYSLYMLWVPLLESYLNQIPTFLIFNGDLSYTWIRGRSMVTSLRL